MSRKSLQTVFRYEMPLAMDPRIVAIVLHVACILRKLVTGNPIAFHVEGIRRELRRR